LDIPHGREAATLFLSASELISEIQQSIDEADALIEERLAIAIAGRSIEQLAIETLQRPERYPGNSHQVARAWLANYAPNRGILRRGEQ
jgi:hypothetical protein